MPGEIQLSAVGLPAPSKRSLALRDVVLIFYRRKWQMATWFILVLGAVALATFLMPPAYVAQAKLLLTIERTDAIFSPNEESNSFIKPQLSEETLNSEIEILKSASLLKTVARSIGPDRLIPAAYDSSIDEDQRELIAASSLARYLEVKAIRASNIIQISFESTDPKLAAQVTNELCHLYVERHLDMHESSGLYAFFQKQAEASHDTLQASVAALRQFEAEYGLIAPQKQRELALQQLADYETQLQTTRAGAHEASDQIEFLEHQVAAEPDRIRSQTRNVYNSVVGALKQELDSLRVRYKASLQNVAESPERQSPEVRTMRARIAQLEETIHHETTAPSQDISADINRSMMALSSELSQLRSKLIGYRAQEKEVITAIDRLKTRLQEIERVSLTYEALQSQWQLHQNNYLLYAKKREEARISQALDREKIANVSIVDPASVPLAPVRPNRKLNLAMGGILALLVSFGLTFGLGYFDNSIRTSRDIERQLNVPVIVTIPEGHWRPKLTAGRGRVSISPEQL
jgi:uncharacterized protein involved in exopolysaccharide biosynthesis